MNKSNLDLELKTLAQENSERSVSAFFSLGIDETLNQLPEQSKRDTLKTTNRQKRNWLYTAAAVGVLATGILGSGFASPTLAAALSKLPVLNYIYSAIYNDLNLVEENPNVVYGSLFHFGGESGPYNLKVLETQMFNNYSDELNDFIGMDFPKLDGELSFVRVDKYNDRQFEITMKADVDNEPVVLTVVPNAINQPQFEGHSVSPVVKSSVNVNGKEADALTYQFSKTDKTDVTNYLSWQRNGYSLVLASSVSIQELTEISRQVDQMAMELKK